VLDGPIPYYTAVYVLNQRLVTDQKLPAIYVITGLAGEETAYIEMYPQKLPVILFCQP
jgi:hypothetical protein